MRLILLTVLTLLQCALCELPPAFYTKLLSTYQTGNPALTAQKQLNQTRRITIVTAFYHQEGASKHTRSLFIEWIGRFVSNVQAPIVMFTSKSEEGEMRRLRGPWPAVFVTDWADVWDLPPVKDYRKQLEGDQHNMDREKRIYHPRVYAVYGSKAWFLALTASANPFNSEYLFWVDAGSFRNKSVAFHNWPDTDKVHRLFTGAKSRDSMMVGVIGRQPLRAYDVDGGPISRFDNGPKLEDKIMGTFFGGSPYATSWFADSFYHLYDKYINSGRFVGMDQSLFNSVVALNWWRTLYLPCRDLRDKCGSDPWFSFHYAFAADNETLPSCTNVAPITLRGQVQVQEILR